MALRNSLGSLPEHALGHVAVVRFTQSFYDQIAQRLGFSFRDHELLRHALTHSSTKLKKDDYQRLEFLGDRVLALVIAEELFRLNPSHREGDMANLHSNLVRGEICAEVGKQLGISDFIIVGHSEQRKGVNLNASVVGDVVEALIGGIYLDGGLTAAKEFVLRNWARHLEERKSVSKDAKTFLQEWALARGFPIPDYKILKREGLEHSPIFTVGVNVKGKDPVEGSGPSKRLAEMDAAANLLKREEIR
jgi:ribonuclease III